MAPDEVDVPPAQRDELAAAQPGEGRCQVDRGVLLGAGRPHECMDLLGAKTSISVVRRMTGFSTS